MPAAIPNPIAAETLVPAPKVIIVPPPAMLTATFPEYVPARVIPAPASAENNRRVLLSLSHFITSQQHPFQHLSINFSGCRYSLIINNSCPSLMPL